MHYIIYIPVLTFLFVLLGNTTQAHSQTTQTCTKEKLKATSIYCAELFKCYSNEMLNFGNIDIESCEMNAREDYYNACDNAEQRARDRGEICYSSDIQQILSEVETSLNQVIYHGIDNGINPEDKWYGNFLLRIISIKFRMSFNAYYYNLVWPNDLRFENALNRAAMTFRNWWLFAEKIASRRNIPYYGISSSAVEDELDILISNIFSYIYCETDGLIALYSFDEFLGNRALDTSGNENHGDIAAASRVGGIFGDGLLFGFNNSHVKIDDGLYLDKGLITIEVWIKPNKIEEDEVYRIIGGYNYHGFYFQIRDGRLEVLFDGQSYHYGTVSIQPDVWTHIALTSDGTYIVTYVDGIEDARSNITLPIQNIVNFRIGAHWIYTGGSSLTDYVQEFPGIIDELRIWDIARTLSEIIGDYNQQLIRPPNVSIEDWNWEAVYSFDESSGIIAYDSSGLDNHGDIAAASRVAGYNGNGLLFGADNARVTVNNILQFYDGLINIEAWIKPNKIEKDEVYRIIGGYDYGGFYFQIRDGRLEVLFDGQSYHYGAVSIQPDVWTHIALTSDGTDIATYVNGIEDARSNITLPIRNLLNVRIGAHWIYTGGSPLTDYMQEFPGIIDELEISTGVLALDY